MSYERQSLTNTNGADSKRQQYDAYGLEGLNGGRMGPDVDLDDILNMFGGMGGMGGMPGMHGMHGMGGMPGTGGMGGRGKPRGRDVVQKYEVSLEELYKGKTAKFGATRNVLCSQCKGSGGKEGTKPKPCGSCDGKGWTASLRNLGGGLVTQEQVPCATCKGNAQIYKEKDKCRKCKGTCVKEEKKVLELYIPRGAKDGDKVVLEGEADEVPGVETGNIVFIIDEQPHEHFARAGADLTSAIKITLQESLCGFSRVVIKHLDGRGIQITHPRGKIMKPGQVLKIGGEGMPYKKGDEKGDLYLVVDVEFPDEAWMDVEANIAKVQDALPNEKPKIEGVEQVDDVEFDPDGDLEDVGARDGHGGGSAWVDEDDEGGEGENVQCAQQ